MINTKISRRNVIKFAFSVTGIAASVICSPWQMQVLLAKPSHRNVKKKSTFTPPPIPNNGSPAGRCCGAGSHGPCQADANAENKYLTVLVPAKQEGTKTYVWGKMTSKHPTIWFYVPYRSGTYAEFILQDKGGTEIYRGSNPLKSTPGVIGYDIPPMTTANLKPGELYKWFLKVKCNPEGSTDDYVQGWLQWFALDSSIENELRTAEPLERAWIYAEQGIWYDALNILAELRYEAPENTANATAWNDLLQQVGLSHLSKEAVVDPYSSA